MKLFIPCIPRGKGRPRTTRFKSGASHTYTPDATVDLEERIRWHWREKILGGQDKSGPSFPRGVPLRVKLTFRMPRPASVSKRVEWHLKRPDVDNMAKLALDALGQPKAGIPGLAYAEDSQVVCLAARKGYADGIEPGIEIVIEEMEDE